MCYFLEDGNIFNFDGNTFPDDGNISTPRSRWSRLVSELSDNSYRKYLTFRKNCGCIATTLAKRGCFFSQIQYWWQCQGLKRRKPKHWDFLGKAESTRKSENKLELPPNPSSSFSIGIGSINSLFAVNSAIKRWSAMKAGNSVSVRTHAEWGGGAITRRRSATARITTIVAKPAGSIFIHAAQHHSVPARATMNPEGKRSTIMDYHNLSRYLIAVAIGHMLLDRKLLRKNEFLVFENMMREKYGCHRQVSFETGLCSFRHKFGADKGVSSRIVISVLSSVLLSLIFPEQECLPGASCWYDIELRRRLNQR